MSRTEYKSMQRRRKKRQKNGNQEKQKIQEETSNSQKFDLQPVEHDEGDGVSPMEQELMEVGWRKLNVGEALQNPKIYMDYEHLFGPTKIPRKMESELSYFEKLWSKNIWEHILKNTNEFA